MSVAGIPAFLEVCSWPFSCLMLSFPLTPVCRLQERSVFIRERANGLYAPGHYHLATTLVSIPFLFVCALCYTLIM